MVEIYEGDRPFIKLGDLEFGQLRTDLGNYLQGSGIFNDYDFEGSAMSALLDLLAYNSTLYGYYANMIANEGFLDTAQRAESVFSHAKPLSYLPASTKGARAQVIVRGTTNLKPGDLFIGGGLKWTPVRSYGVSGDTEIELYQGQQINDRFYQYDSSINHQKFEIPSQTVDTNTLRVYVDNGNGQESEYTNITDLPGSIAGVTAESKIYYLTTSTRGKYAVYFGDNFVGKKPNNQALVRFEYFETAGPNGNNIAQFVSNTSGVSVVTTTVAGVGGSEVEDIESVRTNAPLFFQTQGRYVTASDHLAGISQSGIRANVWGGEENQPPNYGRVYVSAVGVDGGPLTSGQKSNVLSLMKDKGVVTILPTFVEPIPVDLVIEGNVFWDATRSGTSIDIVTSNIVDYINDYQRGAFDVAFNYPIFSVGLTSLDDGIIGDTLEVYMERTVEEGSISDTIPLRNQLQRTNLPGVVRSTNFLANVNGSFPLVYVFDDGRGIMKMFSAQDATFIKNVGSVNYETGLIQLNDIQNTDEFKIRARPRSNTVLAQGAVLFSTKVGDLEVLSS